jgi:hypothetical protein
MLPLEPFLEFGLMTRAAIVPDRQDALLFGHFYFPATTMISTL